MPSIAPLFNAWPFVCCLDKSEKMLDQSQKCHLTALLSNNIALLASLCFTANRKILLFFKEWFVLEKKKFTLIAFCKCRCDCGIIILLTEISTIYTVKLITEVSRRMYSWSTVNPNKSNNQQKSKKLVRVFGS